MDPIGNEFISNRYGVIIPQVIGDLELSWSASKYIKTTIHWRKGHESKFTTSVGKITSTLSLLELTH